MRSKRKEIKVTRLYYGFRNNYVNKKKKRTKDVDLSQLSPFLKIKIKNKKNNGLFNLYGTCNVPKHMYIGEPWPPQIFFFFFKKRHIK